MRNFIFLSLVIIISCNNHDSNANASSDTTVHKNVNTETAAAGCLNNLYFKKGTIIDATTYDGAGKVIGLQTSAVTKVYNEADKVVSEIAMKTSNADGKDEKNLAAIYKCDGENFEMDMNFLRGPSDAANVKAAGMFFPLQLKAGQTLPDANHTINIASSGKNMKISSHIRDRKVEAKETITTPAGKFEAFRISAVIDATTEMEGMTEAMKKSMEEIKKRMGENRFIIWYSPELVIVRMEMYMGDKLQSKTEVTRIRK